MRLKLNLNKKLIFLWLGLLFILLLECTVKWIGDMFGRINMDEIVLMLQLGPGGIDAEILWSFISKVVLRSLGWSFVLVGVCAWLRRYKFVPILIWTALVVVMGMRIVDENIQFGSFLNTKKLD